MEYNVFVPFFIGLASLLHCVGMCGGIIGALTVSLPQQVRDHPLRLASFVAAYNLGRITSYAIAGFLVGGLGTRAGKLMSPDYGHTLIQVLASLLLAAIGLYIAGWFPAFVRIEQLGRPIWRRLEPLGKRLLPVNSQPRAFLFGLVWGWLPCGLVYTTLFWVLSAQTAVQGAVDMALFGVGTLPGVMTAGMLTGWLARIRNAGWARRLFGLLLIAMALASLYPMFATGVHRH
jgi:sulfite exporter TauE/SafE